MLASDPSSGRRRAAILLTVLAILAALVPLAPAAALPPQRALASQHEVSPAQAVPMNGTSAAASRRHGLARTPGRPPAPHGPRVSGGGPAASGGGSPVDPPLATFGSGTGVSVANGFPGYADAQYGCFADPCEWPNSVAAVNNQRVVQATDIDLRISTPNGILLADADLRSFLGMPAGDAFIGDMQVVYDADNTRWLLSGRGGSCDTGRVYLAVSGGADPLAPWTIYMWSYAGEVVDHPRIGESGSGIYTVAYNLWTWSSCTFGAFQGAELLLADAADARAGNALTASFETVGNLFDPVPSVGGSRLEVAAQSLGSDPADVDLFAITGTPATHAIVDETLLSAVAGGSTWPAAPLPSGFPAPGADLSSGPTHLVVDGNELLIAGNIGCTPAGSGTVRDCVRAMRITRTSGSATLDDDLVVGEAGFDEFGPTIVGTGDIGLTFVRSSGAGMSWVTSLARHRAAGGGVPRPGRPAHAPCVYRCHLELSAVRCPDRRRGGMDRPADAGRRSDQIAGPLDVARRAHRVRGWRSAGRDHRRAIRAERQSRRDPRRRGGNGRRRRGHGPHQREFGHH